MANWMKKEGIKPIKKKGPKDALDYMDETELIAHAEDAQNSIDIFKSDDNFYTNMDMSDADKAKNRMNAIVQNAEDKKKFLDALKRNYPKSKYKDTKVEDSYTVISEGDEGFKEISEKLGITARPGDNLKLDDNVIKGPWKKSSKTTAPGTYNITDHIEYIKTLEPVEAMKEANKVLKGEGRYKGLSKQDQETIVNDETVTDHIFERNVDPDPEDFAQGGRVGFDSGGWGKGDSNIIDEDWDEGYDDMEGILRLLNQDQTAPQTVAQLDTEGLLDLINQKHGAGSLMRGSDTPQPAKPQEIELRELFNKWNSMYNG
jgi:hypothetical protein